MAETDELLLSSYDTDEDNAAPSDSTVDDTDTRQARVDALLESIASIPPIVDILLSNLSYKDNLACLHVCKLWSSIAQGYLWRHVRFRFDGAGSVPLTPAQNAIIRSRVHRIRSLTTPLADTTLLDMPCTQLKSLEIWPRTNFTAPDFLMGFHPEAETPLQTPHVGPSALDLIPMNRHLSSISFKQIEHLSRSFTPELFLSFSQLPLQSLLLGITWHVSETLPLAAFLAHCPATLERLELSYDRRLQRFFGQFLDEVSMTSEQAAQLPWSPLPVLKTLKISPSFPIRDATMVVLPLLRHCPKLEELWMPPLPSVHMATEFFNLILRNSLSIKTLRLSPPCEPQQLGWYSGSLSQDLLRVANTYRGLREVELEVKIQEEYPVIPTLVLNSGWSLEIIDLSCYKPELGIFKNPYVTPILKNCSRLKRLAINGQGRGKGFVSLRDLVETNWASNQLESLTVVVSEMGKEYRENGWFVEKFVKYQEDNEQLQEDIAMLLFQLSMKYRAQKNYMGPIPAWLEAETVLLPFAAAVKHTDGAMSLAAWKRIRPVNSEPLCNVQQQPI